MPEVDIREFVAARLKDREDYALQAAEEFGPDWIEIWSGTVDLTANRPDRQPEGRNGWDTHVATSDSRVSRFMVQNDPTRVLADVAATRRLLAEIEAITVTRTDGGRDPDELERPAGRMLRALAARNADHPDFHPAWKLDT